MASGKRLDPSNIVVRRAGQADAEALAAIYGQPRAVWGTLQLPYGTADDWRERLQRGPKDGTYAFVAVVEGVVCGNLGLMVPMAMRRRHAASIGMAVHDAYYARGVGSALLQAALEFADNWLNVLRLELEVYVDNEPALALYRKFGFETEGRLRKFAFRNGEYVDVFIMSRIKAGQ